MERQATELTRWTIHGERVVDDTRRARLSIAEVELPDGVRFEQYVIRAPRSAMVAVQARYLDSADRKAATACRVSSAIRSMLIAAAATAPPAAAAPT